MPENNVLMSVVYAFFLLRISIGETVYRLPSVIIVTTETLRPVSNTHTIRKSETGMVCCIPRN